MAASSSNQKLTMKRMMQSGDGNEAVSNALISKNNQPKKAKVDEEIIYKENEEHEYDSNGQEEEEMSEGEGGERETTFDDERAHENEQRNDEKDEEVPLVPLEELAWSDLTANLKLPAEMSYLDFKSWEVVLKQLYSKSPEMFSKSFNGSEHCLHIVARFLFDMFLNYFDLKQNIPFNTGISLWEHRWLKNGIIKPLCYHGMGLTRMPNNTYSVKATSEEGMKAISKGAKTVQFRTGGEMYVQIENKDKMGCAHDSKHDTKETKLDHSPKSCSLQFTDVNKATAAMNNFIQMSILKSPSASEMMVDKIKNHIFCLTDCYCTFQKDLPYKLKGRQICKLIPYGIEKAKELEKLDSKNAMEEILVQNPFEFVMVCKNPQYGKRGYNSGDAKKQVSCNMKVTMMEMRENLITARKLATTCFTKFKEDKVAYELPKFKFNQEYQFVSVQRVSADVEEEEFDGM